MGQLSEFHGWTLVPHSQLPSLRTGFLPFDPDKALCAGGGAWYDCRLNKWGDKVVACEKWCGLPPLLPVFWQKTMYTDCAFENTHPEDGGAPQWMHWCIVDFPLARRYVEISWVAW
ncbi:unnamed protein product [Cladocopium goreaui]|uniref:Uncharacterized protein n=1 Tax=Cladocopium goreaui TaxID=2562237 RepID=A0A9P1CFA4_9DINO|nr:unnamed protein product [Cladocopium goreaui]